MGQSRRDVPLVVTAAVGLGLMALSRRSGGRASGPAIHGTASGRTPEGLPERKGGSWRTQSFRGVRGGRELARTARGSRRSEREGSRERVDRGGASETGRGRQAVSPMQIPWPGWKDILWRTYNQVGEDRILAVAAGVTFYALLALFPAISALVSSYALFFDPQTIQQHLAGLASFIPEDAFGIVNEQVTRVVQQGGGSLSVAFVASLAFAIWSANNGVKAIIDALNVAYDEEETRSFIRLTLVSLTFTVGGIVAFLLSIGAIVVLPIIFDFVGLGGWFETLLNWARWPLLVLLLLGALAILYRYAPDRDPPQFQWVSVGGVFAAVAWLAGSLLLSWYLSSFADYNATYGSLGAAIGLMMWLWISAIVILVGAELNSEIEHQTARDTTVGPEQPMGARGAVKADTLGEAVASSSR